MIDTIKLVAHTYDLDVVKELNKTRESVDPAIPMRTVDGYLGNMRVRVREDGDLRVDGSLTKFFLGSNVENMSCDDIYSAVHLLAERLGFDPRHAELFRVDIGATFEMAHPASLYLDCLGYRSRYKLFKCWGSKLQTVRYFTGARTLQFYDKGAKDKIEGNLLRYEYQIKRKLKGSYSQPVYLVDLYGDFLPWAVKQWQKGYRRIVKLGRPLYRPCPNWKELREMLAATGLEAVGGLQPMLSRLHAWKEGGYISPTQCYKQAAHIRSLATNDADEGDHVLIQEFGEAIARQAREVLGFDSGLLV